MPTLIHMLPRGGVEKRVARIAQPGDVKIRAVVLIGDAHIDVADADDVALSSAARSYFFCCMAGFLPGAGILGAGAARAQLLPGV